MSDLILMESVNKPEDCEHRNALTVLVKFSQEICCFYLFRPWASVRSPGIVPIKRTIVGLMLNMQIRLRSNYVHYFSIFH